jgi:hypothetical protein
MYWTSISCIIVDNIASLPLYGVIFQHISKKPLVSVTLIDLIYRDLIVYVYLHSLTLAVAFIHCLIELENGAALNYMYSALYSTFSEIFVFCVSSSLILSGGLRLITLIKKSESEVNQLLGSEDVAIVKIRTILILLSIVYESVVIFYLDTHSSIFNLMHHVETGSILHSVRSDHYRSLFMVLPTLAVLVNVITKVYSMWIKRKMNRTLETITIYNDGQNTNYFANEELFSVSLGAALGVPFWMIVAFVASFANRELRLRFFLPLQLMLLNLIFPIYIISKNSKMKNSFLGPVQEQFNKVLASIRIQITNRVMPVYVLPQ